MLLESVQVGPSHNNSLPKTSIGNLFFSNLHQWEPQRTIMIDCSGEEITYERFLSSSIALGKKLQSLGVKKGDVITVVSKNSWKYLLTIVSGFYVGATVNCLNPDYTYGEMKHLFDICQPTLVFCTSDTLDTILQIKAERQYLRKIVIYDSDTTQEAECFDNFLKKDDAIGFFRPVELVPSDEVALILTSSGTTGLPKCVQLTHTNLHLTVLYAHDSRFFDINENESVLAFLPFFHVFGQAVSLSAILYGAKIVILDKFVPDNFLKSIQDHKISKLFVVPPVLLFLVKSPLVQKYDISSIEDVLCGGAAASKDLEELVQNRLNVTSVRQIYGMTEMCGAATVVPKNAYKYGSSGKAVTSCQIKICDQETGKILPVGEVGELRMKSDGLMKGYLGNEKETKEAVDGEGFLKTGDLGYCDSDGFFYIVGRLKEIIKYKGFQVSPAELENLLVQHPAVKDAGVVGVADERAGELPLAFVVLQPNKEVNEQELVDFVAEYVSAQKRLYGGVRFVDQIPKNASGKILRKKLQELL